MATEELEQLRVQVARLQEQLAEEQQLRRAAEATTEAIAADRNRLQVPGCLAGGRHLLACPRPPPADANHPLPAADAPSLQRARDELAAALLAAEKRALEAEEEAAHAHAAAAAAQQHLQAGGGGGGGAAGPDGATQQQQQQAAADGAAPSPQRRQLTEEEAADAEVLLAALDQERQRRWAVAWCWAAAARSCHKHAVWERRTMGLGQLRVVDACLQW